MHHFTLHINSRDHYVEMYTVLPGTVQTSGPICVTMAVKDAFHRAPQLIQHIDLTGDFDLFSKSPLVSSWGCWTRTRYLFTVTASKHRLSLTWALFLQHLVFRLKYSIHIIRKSSIEPWGFLSKSFTKHCSFLTDSTWITRFSQPI